MGYHTEPIPKGVLGEASKIEEEFLEFKDALSQGVKIMALLELSDMLGAMEAYLKKNNLTLDDAIAMMRRTQSAFQDGTRQ